MYSRWTNESPIGQESGILLSQKHVSWVGKISAQPHTTLCIQFLNRENNEKNNTFPLGKQICFTIVWGCAETLPLGGSTYAPGWVYGYIYIYIKSYTHILIGPYPWSIGGQMHGWHNQLKQHFASLSYQTNRFCVAMHLFSSRSQKISWCDKISETLSFASCATFSFLAHFVDIWDLHVLLKRIAKGRGAPHFVSCRKSGVL